MTHNEPPAVESGLITQSANAASVGHMSKADSSTARLMRQILLFGLLINTTLFFRGCSMSDTHFTTGFPLPALEYHQDMSQSSWTSGDVRILWHPMALNLGCLGALAVAAFWAKPLRKCLSHRVSVAALLVVFLAFNCVLVSPTLWVNTTFSLQAQLVEILLGDERRVWVMDTFSRAYFVAFVGCVAALISGGHYLWRTKISAPHGERWQIQLVGLFVLTTLVGLLTALIHQLLPRH